MSRKTHTETASRKTGNTAKLTYAGLLKKARSGTLEIAEGATIVCTLTGHGLKDPDTAVGGVKIPEPIAVDMEQLLERMELK